MSTQDLVGLEVQIMNTAGIRGGGRASHACLGTITKVSKTQIVVRNEHGNISRHWLAGTGKPDLGPVGGGDYRLANDSCKDIRAILSAKHPMDVGVIKEEAEGRMGEIKFLQEQRREKAKPDTTTAKGQAAFLAAEGKKYDEQRTIHQCDDGSILEVDGRRYMVRVVDGHAVLVPNTPIYSAK